jgi:membrane protease YdiL (CAAX protease family)
MFNSRNRLFALASQGGKTPSAFAAIGVAFLVIVLAVLAGQLLSRLILFTPRGSPQFSSSLQPVLSPVVQDVTMFLLIFAGLWAWLRWSSRRPFWTLGFERDHAGSRALRGLVVAACMITSVTTMIVLLGVSLGPGLVETFGFTAFGIRLVSLLSYGVQGPAEEALFRGWLMPVLGARYRPIIGIIGSSALFSVAHGLSQGITSVGFLNLFLFGLFTALYALAEGGLWGVAAWHSVWNWMQGDVFGFSLDGSPHVGLVRSIQPTGPALVTGGAFGPEGGLACTAVLLAGMLVVIAWGKHRGPSHPAEISRASD